MKSQGRDNRFRMVSAIAFALLAFLAFEASAEVIEEHKLFNLQASLNELRETDTSWYIRLTWTAEKFGNNASNMFFPHTIYVYDRNGVLQYTDSGGGTVSCPQIYNGNGYLKGDWNGIQFSTTISLAKNTNYYSVRISKNCRFWNGITERTYLPDEIEFSLPPLRDQSCPVKVGNPTNITTGNKSYRKTDLRIDTPGGKLEFSRTYNSTLGPLGDDYTLGPLGYGWNFSYNYQLMLRGSSPNRKASFRKEDGEVVVFAETGSTFNQTTPGERFTLTDNGDGTFTLVQSDGSRIHFTDTIDDNAQFLRPDWMEDVKGRRLTFSWASYRYAYQVWVELLTQVSDEWGNGFGFEHEPGVQYSGCDPYSGRISAVYNLKNPAEKVIFSYSSELTRLDNLESVSYPDGTSLHHYYEHPDHNHSLTRAVDENGDTTYYEYDTYNRSVSQYKEGNSDKLTFTYDWRYAAHGPWKVTVTDSLDRVSEYGITESGNQRSLSISGPTCGGGCGSTRKYKYNKTNGNLLETEDGNGIKTQYTNHDVWGNATVVTEAVGTPEERITTYSYDPNLNVLLSKTTVSVLAAGNKETIYDYDDDGDSIPNENPTPNLYRLIEKGYTRDLNGAIVLKEYITTYTNNSQGQVTSIDGPRMDVNDVTTYAYYPEDPGQGNNRGLLYQVTDALGHTTTYGDYNIFGKPGYVTDPNGLTTHYAYDTRGRVSTFTLEGASAQGEDLITSNFYDGNGNLNYILLPGGGVIDYEYDAAGKLLSIIRRVGPDATSAAIDSIAYTYDTEGNKTAETLHEGEATDPIKKTTTFAYDDYNRLWKLIHADSTFQEYGYDPGGNRTRVKNEKIQETTYLFDALNRLTTVTAPESIITWYNYDKHDNLTQVTDPETTQTQYEYDDFGRLLKVNSPDAGITEYCYDEAGNLIKKTDANGIISLYTYDALNRLLTVSPPDSSESITYGYDSSTVSNGVGRLTSISDPSGTLTCSYDKRGNVIREEKAIEGLLLVIQYEYAPDGTLSKIIYPNGRTLSATLNQAGQITQIEGEKEGSGETYVQGVDYLPFGPMKAYETGDGITTTLTHDEDYQLTGIQAGTILDRTYEYDDTGNITDITDLLDSTKTQSFVYDPLNRLTDASGSHGAISFTYDNAGNRLLKTDSLGTANYTYTHNRLMGIGGTETSTFAYDNAGNQIQENLKTFAYNQHLRLKEISDDGVTLAEYTYDALGRRVKKMAGGATTLFLYDQNGLLIEECDTTGTWQKDYVYLNGQPLTQIVNTGGGTLPFELTVTDGAPTPLPNIPVYVFTEGGSYTGLTSTTNDQGKVTFTLSDGTYKFRADYLGYQFWTEVITYPATLSLTYPIPHQNVTVTVEKQYLTTTNPLTGVNVYLFTAGGSYLGKYQTTNSQGQVTFTVPAQDYKFRADYLSQQYWSATINQQPTTISINHGLAHVTVEQDGTPLNNVNVYVFTESGSYLNISGTTGEQGSVEFQLPAGTYKFRADYQNNQFWSDPVTISANQTNNVSINVGGGVFVLTVTKGGTDYITGIPVYAFTEGGSNLSISGTTNETGQVSFSLAAGNYKFRVDYLGYQFWTDVYSVPTTLSGTRTIPHQDVSVTVQKNYLGNTTPLAGVNVYLFTAAESYLSQNQLTNGNGEVIFNLPGKEYKFRADYLSQQYWSEVINQEDTTININHGLAHVTVAQGGTPINDVPVYVFTETGSYLNINGNTGQNGYVDFELPIGNYKFRADYHGSQYWSDVVTVASDQTTNVSIETGGGAFILTVTKGGSDYLTGINVYAFTEGESYLGLSGTTDTNGQVSFSLSNGNYKFRADYLGYQFWTNVITIPATMADTLTIPHQDVTVTAQKTYLTTTTPLSGVNVYLFTASDSYLGQYQVTNSNGEVSFNLPAQEYKFRADYLNQQYWSQVINQQNATITINNGLAHVTVEQAGSPLTNVNVYVFTDTNSYLNINGNTGSQGYVEFELPQGAYKFRADYQGSQYWSDPTTVSANQTSNVSINAGGGVFTLTVTKGGTDFLVGINVYAFTEGGSYLGLYDTTDANGEVTFGLSNGNYKFRADYLGYQFWTEVYTVPNTLSGTLSIPHQDVTVTVQKTYLGSFTPLPGVNVYLFTSGGSYMGKVQQTDGNGQTTFNLPAKNYKFRADYLSQQYWSVTVNQQSTTITINCGLAVVNVNNAGTPLGNVNVYVFNAGGSYLGITGQTNPSGDVSFELPAGSYKFRADYSGTQYWSNVETITADQTTNANIDIQTAPHSFLERYYQKGKEKVMVASLGNLQGILSHAFINQIPGDEVYYYHNDHLGTPQKTTDSAGTVVWKADYLPFGEAAVDEDPDGDGNTVTNNLRFPGQYYDQETGLHYNWHRDYKPEIGRYIESDPMGLREGNNLYSYVINNPVRFIDPFGLIIIDPGQTFPNTDVLGKLFCMENELGVEVHLSSGERPRDTGLHGIGGGSAADINLKRGGTAGLQPCKVYEAAKECGFSRICHNISNDTVHVDIWDPNNPEHNRGGRKKSADCTTWGRGYRNLKPCDKCENGK